MTIAIIIPAHHEERHIYELVRDACALPLTDHKVIVVDDGSRDRTSERARAAGAIVLRHRINLGKGAALKTGCDAAYQRGAQLFFTIDGDGQHRVDDIPRALAAHKATSADIVFGARAFDKQMPIAQRAGNIFFTKIIARLFKVNLTDTQTGFHSFTRRAYERIRWENSGYAVETEIIARMSKANLSFATIPIQTIYHDVYKGTTPLDGVKILTKLIALKLFL